MYETDSQIGYRDHTRHQHENWTTGGALAYLLVVPVTVAFMAMPAVMVGVVLGMVALTLGSRLTGWLRRPPGDGGLSPPEPSRRPA